MELISRAVVLALVGLVTSDFFVSNAYAKYLWVIIAICPVLLRIARRDASSAGVAAATAPGQSRRAHRVPALAPQHAQ